MLPPTLALYIFSLLQFTHVSSALSIAGLVRRGVPVVKRASRDVPSQGFHNPYDSGGHLLTVIPVTYPQGQGEPINAVISGHSDERVLKDQEVDGGLRNYFLSLGFAGNCLGQKSDSMQAANLGDGNGDKNETAVMRWHYGDPQFGTCKETIEGGNHFRYWTQDGPEKNSGAVFMAVSYEMPIALKHDIIPNGYNLGRDWLVGNITQSPIQGWNLTDGTTFEGKTSSASWTYKTTIKYVAGIAPNTSDAINHNITVTVPGINASDGMLAVLEVHIDSEPGKTSFGNKNLPPAWQLLSLLVTLAVLPYSIAL